MKNLLLFAAGLGVGYLIFKPKDETVPTSPTTSSNNPGSTSPNRNTDFGNSPGQQANTNASNNVG